MFCPILLGAFVAYPRVFYLVSQFEDAGLSAVALSSLDRFFFYSYVFLSREKYIVRDFERMREVSARVPVRQDEEFAAQDHTVVLIMGESLSRNYMHCYGYPLPNTPYLDSLAGRGELILFDDAVSSSIITMGAVPEVLSFHKYEDPEGWLSYPALLPVLKKLGYQTHWISRHERRGVAVNRIGVMAEDFDFSHYVTQGYDDALLRYLNEDGAGKRFDFIHLLGSHVLFKHRFPKEYARFCASDIPRRSSDFAQERYEILADYANSVLFNDYVVGRIIEHYRDRKAIVIYMSDHGQALYDDPTLPDTHGHALSPMVAQIPSMVYLSPSM